MASKVIAMWSGPRNISTALMRAWENRPDTFVYDEPLYAHYLWATERADHPGYEATLAHHETDWRRVVERMTGPVPAGRAIFFQKHMAHHLLPEVGVGWLGRMRHFLLIRDPAEVLRSLAEFLPSPTADDTGLPHQVRLYERLCQATGTAPAVVDARDVLAAPRATLQALCRRLEVPFREQMLQWPPGPRASDGAWAPYWYQKVYRTTGFGPSRPPSGAVADRWRAPLAACAPLYARLYARRLAAEPPPGRASVRGAGFGGTSSTGR